MYQPHVLEFTDRVAIAGADCRACLKAVKRIVYQKPSKAPVDISPGAFDGFD
jgi:hypothetical protein